MANIVRYKVIGRYADGRRIVGYHLVGSSGRQGMFSIGQMAFLVGKGVVDDVTAQLYQDKVLFRGNDLEKLPTKQIGGNNKPTNIGVETPTNNEVTKKKDTTTPAPNKTKETPAPTKTKETPAKIVPAIDIILKEEPDNLYIGFVKMGTEVYTRIIYKNNVFYTDKNMYAVVYSTIYGFVDENSKDFLNKSVSDYIPIIFQACVLECEEGIENFKVKRIDYRQAYILIQRALQTKILNKAYTLTETVMNGLANYKVKDTQIKIIGTIGDEYVIRIRDWGNVFSQDVRVSKSTMACLASTFKDKVKHTPEKFNNKIPKFHYHEVVLWIGNLRYLAEFKHLKLRYIDFNKKYFNNRLPNDLLVSVLNYDAKQFSDIRSSGYYNSLCNLIMLNAQYHVMNRDGLKRYSITTLLHEMCHTANNVDYGTCRNKEGEDAVSLGYFKDVEEEWMDQKYSHGKYFIDEVNKICNKTGFSFAEIYSYGSKSEESKTRKELDRKDIDTLESINDASRYTSSSELVILRKIFNSKNIYDYMVDRFNNECHEGIDVKIGKKTTKKNYLLFSLFDLYSIDGKKTYNYQYMVYASRDYNIVARRIYGNKENSIIYISKEYIDFMSDSTSLDDISPEVRTQIITELVNAIVVDIQNEYSNLMDSTPINMNDYVVS